MAGRGIQKKFRFKNKLVSLDASTIDLSLSLFDWAKFRRTKGAVKLHLLLDHDGYLPSFAVITTGKTSDIKVARRLLNAEQWSLWTGAILTTTGLSNYPSRESFSLPAERQCIV